MKLSYRMSKTSKPRNIEQLSDEELITIIKKQNNFLAEMSPKQQEEYKQQKSKYTLSNEIVSLGYFGARHIFEPNHPQFEEIQTYFQTFIEGKYNIIVLVESSVPETTLNVDHDIHTAGERGFITHLAKEMGMKVECIEPDRIAEISYLLQNFKPDDIEYYYYLRGIRDYFRLGRIQDNTTFEEYSQQLLNTHKKLFGSLPHFSNFDFSLEHMKVINKNITGKDFDINNRLDVNPRKLDTIIGQIAHATDLFRDFSHIRKIEQCLNDGYCVFIVNGEDHAVIQRPVLERMF